MEDKEGPTSPSIDTTKHQEKPGIEAINSSNIAATPTGNVPSSVKSKVEDQTSKLEEMPKDVHTPKEDVTTEEGIKLIETIKDKDTGEVTEIKKVPSIIIIENSDEESTEKDAGISSNENPSHKNEKMEFEIMKSEVEKLYDIAVTSSESDVEGGESQEDRELRKTIQDKYLGRSSEDRRNSDEIEKKVTHSQDGRTNESSKIVSENDDSTKEAIKDILNNEARPTNDAEVPKYFSDYPKQDGREIQWDAPIVSNVLSLQDAEEHFQSFTENSLPAVASVTTSVMGLASSGNILEENNCPEREQTTKNSPDSLEYDSLNSGSFVSAGSSESLDKLGADRLREIFASDNTSDNQALKLSGEVQKCGKCDDGGTVNKYDQPLNFFTQNVLSSNNFYSLPADVNKKNAEEHHVSLSNDKYHIPNGNYQAESFQIRKESEQFDDGFPDAMEKKSSIFSKAANLPSISLDGTPGGSDSGDTNKSCLIEGGKSKFDWRRLLAQVLAVSAKNTLALNFGMSIGFQTIAIPSLRKRDSDLYLDEDQISLFGSLFFTIIPIGCLLSGPTIHGWGRKPAMLVFCLPLFAGWWIYYCAKSPIMLYLAILLMGLVNGLLEAPILTYVAEVTEARWRGMLASTSIVAALFGVFLQLLFGNIFTWRTTAIVNSVFPILSFVSIYFVPESPHWLASKGREKDVEKSLMWLRGWVDRETVAAEVESLMAAHRNPKVAATPLSWKGYASRTFVEPFLLVLASFAIGHLSGMATVQTYSVSIFDAFGVSGWSWSAAMGATQVLGATACVIALPLVGKRPIAVIAMVGVAVGMAGAATANGPLAASMLLVANFSTNACSRVIPWVLIGEVFTNEMRAVASGLSSCLGYAMGFVLSYTYLRVLSALTLRGLLGVYAGFGAIGSIAYYFYLPETEGKSLAEVQDHFARKKTGVDNPTFEKEKP